MGVEESNNLVLEHYEAFVHRQDAEAVRKQLANDFRDHDMPAGVPAGPEGALQYRKVLHSAFPDLHVRIDDIGAEGDRVAVRDHLDGHASRTLADPSYAADKSRSRVYGHGVLAHSRCADRGTLGGY